MDGRRLRRDLRGGTLSTRNQILRLFFYLLRSHFQDLPIPRSRQFGRSRKQNWYGERRRMDVARGERIRREAVSHPLHHEVCFSGRLRIHRRVGRKRELHESVRERKRDSRRGPQAREIASKAMRVRTIYLWENSSSPY